jgi:protein-S-isoprenylcysteine O-methyltransferase Ste14
MPVWMRAAVFVVVVPGAVAGWIPWYLAGLSRSTVGIALAALGVAFIAAGWSVLLWCARDFATRGCGTPAPSDPPRELVTGGLCRIVRNPMYAGVLSAILGQAVPFGSHLDESP